MCQVWWYNSLLRFSTGMSPHLLNVVWCTYYVHNHYIIKNVGKINLNHVVEIKYVENSISSLWPSTNTYQRYRINMQFHLWPLDGGSKTAEITIFDSLHRRQMEPTLALGQSEAQQWTRVVFHTAKPAHLLHISCGAMWNTQPNLCKMTHFKSHKGVFSVCLSRLYSKCPLLNQNA